jgi:hypothetical protein
MGHYECMLIAHPYPTHPPRAGHQGIFSNGRQQAIVWLRAQAASDACMSTLLRWMRQLWNCYISLIHASKIPLSESEWPCVMDAFTPNVSTFSNTAQYKDYCLFRTASTKGCLNPYAHWIKVAFPVRKFYSISRPHAPPHALSSRFKTCLRSALQPVLAACRCAGCLNLRAATCGMSRCVSHGQVVGESMACECMWLCNLCYCRSWLPFLQYCVPC